MMNSFEKRHHKNRLKLQENSTATRESASNGSTWKNMWKKVTVLLPYMWPKVPFIHYVITVRVHKKPFFFRTFIKGAFTNYVDKTRYLGRLLQCMKILMLKSDHVSLETYFKVYVASIKPRLCSNCTDIPVHCCRSY